MTRTRVIVALVVLAAAGVGLAVLLAPGDDSGSDRAAAPDRVTTTVPSTTTPASTTTTPTTTTPTTTPETPPGPCGAVQAPIRTAIDAGVAGASTGATVSECRLAASDANWALVRLTPSAGSSFSATTVVLHQSSGAWTVAATGGTNAGCGVAPQQVVADLGQFCVGGGGTAQ
jgi:hypothetical protein